MTCGIRDDGALHFHDADGNSMPEHAVEAAKKQNRDALLGLIQRKCDEINERVAALGRLHVDTPAPRRPRFVAVDFDKVPPPEPRLRAVGTLDKLVPGRRHAIEVYRRGLNGMAARDCRLARNIHEVLF
jgi:hypothetical protein